MILPEPLLGPPLLVSVRHHVTRMLSLGATRYQFSELEYVKDVVISHELNDSSMGFISGEHGGR